MATTEVTLISPVQSSVQVTATGYIVPQVTSKVGPHDIGRLARVFVKEGDTVKAGQVLAEMETLDQRSAIAAAGVAGGRRRGARRDRAGDARGDEAEGGARASARGARGGREERPRRSRRVAGVARRASEGAEAEVTAAEAERATLGVNLRERTIVAPIDGTVVAKPMKPGEVTNPGDATPIVELVDFSSLLAEVDVPENRLAAVKLGGPADIVLDAYPDQHFRGEVVEFGKRVDRPRRPSS